MAFQPKQNPALNSYHQRRMPQNSRMIPENGRSEIGRSGMNSNINASYPNPNPNQSLSTNEEDYKDYVLFVIPGDAASQRAQEIAARHTDVKIKNIYQIPPQSRPTWLTGAPILWDKGPNKAYRGTAALRMLEGLHREETIGISSYGGGSGIGYSIDSNSSNNAMVPILDDESRYTNGGKVGENDLNKYQQARASSGIIQKK